MVEIFGFKLFGSSESNKTRRQSRKMKRKRSYRGGYKYKQSGNNAGEDVSNSQTAASRRSNRSRSNMDDSGMGKGTKRRRMR